MKKFILLLFFSSYVFAENSYYQKNSLFIEGYDPVSYIVNNEAQKGKSDISYVYDNIKILFANKEHKSLFIANPKKYIPAYNGWCAYAMFKDGSLYKVNPKAFKVVNGKTYLFYKGFWADTLKKWNKKEDDLQIKQADNFWNKRKSSH